MSGVRVVRAEGSPLERGRQVGRGLGDLIERSLDLYHRYLERRGVGSEQLQGALDAEGTRVTAQSSGRILALWGGRPTASSAAALNRCLS